MATIQTRLTSDNKQHDEAFKKSKQQVYNYNKQVDQSKASILKFAKGGLGALSAAVGVAGGAMAAFTKLMRSTEQTSDALDRTMFTLKNSVDKFFQSIATGDLSGFIRDLKDIAKYSAEAYNSLDNLGTSKMWKNVRISQYQAEIEKLKTNGGSKEEINRYQTLIDALQKSLTGDTYNAGMDYLAGLIGKRFKNADMAEFLKKWEEGTLAEYIKDYEKKHSTTFKRLVGTTWSEQTTWDTEGNEKTYSALLRLLSLTEKDGLDVVYNLLNEAYQRQGEAERKKRRNIGSSTSTSTSTTTPTPKTIAEILEWEEENPIEDFKFNDEAVKTIISDMTTLAEVLEDKLIPIDVDSWIGDNEKKEWDLAKATEDANKKLEKQQNILDLQIDTISSLSSAFSSLGNAFDIPGLNIAGIIAEAIANIAKAYSVASAKQAEGSITGWDWLAFSVGGLAQVASAISQIHSLSGYASGGIIGGNSYTGDKVLARVNSGEMILNPSQQANLFNMINGGVSTGGEVKFRIDGSTLVGVLNNYNKKVRRVM